MPKSEKMIKMLDLICESPGELDALALATLCDVSERGIYRYMSTLRRAGINISFNFDGNGYRVINMQWHYIFEQKKLAGAVKELITRGMRRCQNEELLKQGERALELLEPSRA